MSKTKYYTEYEATGNTQLLIEDSIYINRATKRIAIGNSGNTTTPLSLLHIMGDPTSDQLTLQQGFWNYWTINSLFSNTNADLIFKMSGVEKFRVNANGQLSLGYVTAGTNSIIASGRVGIGIAYPQGPLDIYSASNNHIFLTETQNENYWNLGIVDDSAEFSIRFNAGVSALWISASNHVSIGTGANTEKFTVNGDAAIIGLTTQYTGSTTGFRNVIHSNTTGKLYSVPGGVSNTSGTSGSSYSKLVEYKQSNYTVLDTEEGKTFVHTGSSTFTFQLPTLSAAQIGYEYTFVKLSNTATIYIKAPTYDYIEDSYSGAHIYSNDPNFATITVKFIYRNPTGYGNYWIIKYANGIWITTTGITTTV